MLSIESAAPSIESTVHKKRKEFALSVDSKAVIYGAAQGFFLPSVAFPVCSRLAFNRQLL